VAKGYQANKDHLEALNSFGKSIAKRAGFKCEWCESKEELRVWDHQPDTLPNMDTLAMLCQNCRELADGRKAGSDELRSIRDALWSCIPAVAEGAAIVLAQCNASWVKDAIDQSCIDDSLKEQLLARTQIWK
jgi:protein PhnA